MRMNTFNCPYCGKEIETTGKYCKYCGKEVELPKESQEDNNFKQMWKQNRSASIAVIFALAATLVCFLITLPITISALQTKKQLENMYANSYTEEPYSASTETESTREPDATESVIASTETAYEEASTETEYNAATTETEYIAATTETEYFETTTETEYIEAISETEAYEEPSTQTVPSADVKRMCVICGGTGRCTQCIGGTCQYCRGTGYSATVPTYGTGMDGRVRCTVCINGKCSTCGGTGKCTYCGGDGER